MPRTTLLTGSNSALVDALAEECADAAVLPWEPHRPLRRALPRAYSVWLLTGGLGPVPWHDAGVEADAMAGLVSGLPECGAAELNLVVPGELAHPPRVDPPRPADRAVAHAYRALGERVAKAAADTGTAFRLFTTPAAVSDTDADRLTGPHRLMAVLRSVVADVSARSASYLSSRPLRVVVPEGATVPVLPAREMARALLACAPAGVCGEFRVPGCCVAAAADLCRRAGEVLGVTVVPTTDPAELSEVDLLLHDRLTGWLPARPSPGLPLMTPPAQRRVLRRSPAFRSPPEAAWSIRVAGPLTYHVSGAGADPVVVLNAVGYGVDVWRPLVDRLTARRRRVLVWSWPPGRFLGPAGQAAALAAVLAREGVTRCHLVGWCTGPKTAVEFAARHPGTVASMVFVNGSFKVDGTDDGLDTPYEGNLEFLCRTLVEQPGHARRMATMFGGAAEPVPADATAATVLAAPHGALRAAIGAPFRDEAAITAYAAELTAFWAHDHSPVLAAARVPVLSVSAEYDEVVSGARIRAALPHARHVELRGATHQSVYDRADELAALIDDFTTR